MRASIHFLYIIIKVIDVVVLFLRHHDKIATNVWNYYLGFMQDRIVFFFLVLFSLYGEHHGFSSVCFVKMTNHLRKLIKIGNCVAKSCGANVDTYYNNFVSVMPVLRTLHIHNSIGNVQDGPNLNMF